MSPWRILNLTAFFALVITSLVVELLWNHGQVADASRHFIQKRLVLTILSLIAVELFVQYRRDVVAKRQTGFPVKTEDKTDE